MALPLTSLISCSTVTINDHEITGSLGPAGGASFHTLTNQSATYTVAQVWGMWNDLSNPMVMTSIDTILDFKAALEKLCSFESGTCQYLTPTQAAQVKNLFAQATAYKAKATAKLKATKH